MIYHPAFKISDVISNLFSIFWNLYVCHPELNVRVACLLNWNKFGLFVKASIICELVNLFIQMRARQLRTKCHPKAAGSYISWSSLENWHSFFCLLKTKSSKIAEETVNGRKINDFCHGEIFGCRTNKMDMKKWVKKIKRIIWEFDIPRLFMCVRPAVFNSKVGLIHCILIFKIIQANRFYLFTLVLNLHSDRDVRPVIQTQEVHLQFVFSQKHTSGS